MTASGIEMGDATGTAGDVEGGKKGWREHLAEACEGRIGNETGGSGEREKGWRALLLGIRGWIGNRKLVGGLAGQ